MHSSRLWVGSISVLAFALAGCGALLGVDFDDANAAPDGGAGSNPVLVGAEVDGATCARGDTADCAGRCGRLVGRCGDVVACGGCSAAETCGGGGPNRCGAGVCTPECTGKRCGAPDGCDGVCTTGTCGSGQACVEGRCACGPASCTGCCAGDTCNAGTSDLACGQRGASCTACSGGKRCALGACTSTPPGTCAHAETCPASVRDLGEIDGDVVTAPPPALTAGGTTSQWLAFRLREGNAGIFPANLRARLTLTFPAGSLWEMYLYYDRANPNAFDCTSARGSATGTIARLPLPLEWPDVTGVDDSANVTVEIRYASGTCGPTSSWNLRIEGDAQ